MKEVWKDIQGYEGLYQVSNLGRVKSLDKVASNGQFFKSKVLRQVKSKYKQVCLRSGGGRETRLVHRLVAFAFVSNSEGKPTVNHINGDKYDNRVVNLEWMTHSEQQIHAVMFLGKVGVPSFLGRKGKLHPRAKTISAYYPSGGLFKTYESSSFVREDGFLPSKARACARGERNHHGNLIWKYV